MGAKRRGFKERALEIPLLGAEEMEEKEQEEAVRQAVKLDCGKCCQTEDD